MNKGGWTVSISYLFGNYDLQYIQFELFLKNNNNNFFLSMSLHYLYHISSNQNTNDTVILIYRHA